VRACEWQRRQHDTRLIFKNTPCQTTAERMPEAAVAQQESKVNVHQPISQIHHDVTVVPVLDLMLQSAVLQEGRALSKVTSARHA
jgi:hypothetical protein